MVTKSVSKILIDGIRTESGFDEQSIEKVDLDDLFQTSIHQKIFPYVFRKLMRAVSSRKYDVYKTKYYNFVKKVDVLNDETIKIASECEKKGIHIFITKGIVFSKMIFNDLYLRHCNDIDMIIHEKDVLKIHHLLSKMGYVHVCGGKDPFQRDPDDLLPLSQPTLKDQNHHEFFEYYKKIDNIDIYIELGRSIHESITGDKAKQFFKNRHTLNIIDRKSKITTFDLYHTILMLIENIYENIENWYSSPRLKDVLDFCTFIHKFGNRINWDYMFLFSEKYGISDIVSHVLDQFISALDLSITGLQNVASIVRKFEGKPKESKRFLFNWETSFLDRFFQTKQERHSEICRIVKKRCFSSENPNYHKPLTLKSEEPIKWKVENLTPYEITVTVSLDPAKQEIVFFIQVDENILSDFHQYTLHLVFIPDDLNSAKWVEESIYQFSGGTVMSPDRNLDYSIEEKKINIEEKISCMTFTSSFSFSICIRKNVIANIWHWMSKNPFNKEFWADPPIFKLH